MSQYVVQSGEIREVVQADDAYKAALWAVHLTMESAVQRRLGNRIRVLRTDGVEAGSWPVYPLLLEWNQLMVALDRLEQAWAAEDAAAEATSEESPMENVDALSNSPRATALVAA